ncbi:MAG: hypothetical protein CR982_01855 [Candidatus Cloacimonadota bacterium]|nr:MAG: hypothetical protein CR982_01855 [Candidatus Cloacimonadota bacterium]
MKKILLIFISLVLLFSCNLGINPLKVPKVEKIEGFTEEGVVDYTTEDEAKAFEVVGKAFVNMGGSLQLAFSDIVENTFHRSVDVITGVNIDLKDEDIVVEKRDDDDNVEFITNMKVNSLKLNLKAQGNISNIDLEELSFKAGASVELNLDADLNMESEERGKTFLKNVYLYSVANIKLDVLEGEFDFLKILPPILKGEVDINDTEKLKEYIDNNFGTKVNLSFAVDFKFGGAYKWVEGSGEDAVTYGTKFVTSLKSASLLNKKVDYSSLTKDIIDVISSSSDASETIDGVSGVLSNTVFEGSKVGKDECFLKSNLGLYKSDSTEVINREYSNLDFVKNIIS